MAGGHLFTHTQPGKEAITDDADCCIRKTVHSVDFLALPGRRRLNC